VGPGEAPLRDDAVLEWLPQCLVEHRTRELGKLVEEKNASMGQCFGTTPDAAEPL